ncbi:MAG: formate dehydrogenase accessory protein FdhE [Burkholderiaceae bacterium]|jgi:FdhE protein|nr:formate dehydrogenase accessory protein FdhE [Burkholderiaceae bacterium]
MASTTPRLRTPEEIALNAGADLPRLRLPGTDEFAARALRLRQLAAGHAMRDYLLLMAVLAEAQHARLTHYPAVPLPMPEQADAAAHAGQPLLDATRWPRPAAWRTELRALLAQALDKLPADCPARPQLPAVAKLSDSALDKQADRLLTGIGCGLDLAAAPLIAAGLQLLFTHLVRATAAAQSSPFGIPGDSTRCPCCDSLPTASVTRVGGGSEGYRYLHCALCHAEWHMVRVKCTHCLGTGGVRYQALQALADGGAQPAQSTPPAAKREPVQAETCDTCRHYLKIVHMDKDVEVDPVADDLASLTLDLLLADEGYTRHGVNLLLLFGDGDVQSQ